MSRNWGAMTHGHHLVADGTSRAVVLVDAFGNPLRPPPPRVAPGHKRKNPGGPRQNPPPARARRAEAGTEPAVVVERITVPTSTSTAPLITISNLAGWVGVSAAERSNVDAEIIATNSEFIAVFETQPGDGDAPLGIVCGPVDILPKSVRKVVAARTTSAEIIINRRKMKFKGRMKETDFLEARYLGSPAGGVPTRLVRVAVTGPMRGRTMTAAMVLVLCARVRFFQAGVAAPAPLKRTDAYQFCVDDTVHPSEHNFNAGRPCYDEGSVFAFGAARTPTRDVRYLTAGAYVRAAFASTSTKWLVDQRSVHVTRGIPATIAALLTPPVLSPTHGPLAARFFGLVGDGAGRRSAGTTPHSAAFELCAGQHGLQPSEISPARCCCGLVQPNSTDAFEPPTCQGVQQQEARRF